jgi:hypothetical protein
MILIIYLIVTHIVIGFILYLCFYKDHYYQKCKRFEKMIIITLAILPLINFLCLLCYIGHYITLFFSSNSFMRKLIHEYR